MMMKKSISRFARDESGATAIEYVFLGILIAMVLVAALTTLGQNLSSQFSSIATTLNEIRTN